MAALNGFLVRVTVFLINGFWTFIKIELYYYRQKLPAILIYWFVSNATFCSQLMFGGRLFTIRPAKFYFKD